MKETNTHIYFWGSNFSNWSPCNISYDNQKFHTSEQLFMYLKALFFYDEEIARKIVKEGKDPEAAKYLGRQVRNFNNKEWEKVREEKMYIAVYEKFTSDEKLKQILLNTGNKILVEGSPFDDIWGVKLRWDDPLILDEKNWKGLNLLGKILMKVRDDIKNESLN